MSEHQTAFDALKTALTTAPVLRYPNFMNEFTLRDQFLIEGLTAALSQEDNTGKSHVTAYASRILQSSAWSLCHYSSAKLEPLALKRAVTKMFWDYL